MSSIDKNLIYPYDCYVMGDCTKGTSGRALYFWGYARDQVPDSIQLAYTTSYKYHSDSKEEPIYDRLQLDYLGLRTESIDQIVDHFWTHFLVKKLDRHRLAFITQKGTHQVEGRWPTSSWSFLIPLEEEDYDRKLRRDVIWECWAPHTD